MNNKTEKDILDLELEKQIIFEKTLSNKLKRFRKANERVANAVSQEEIEETELELKTINIQRQILEKKIEEIDENI